MKIFAKLNGGPALPLKFGQPADYAEKQPKLILPTQDVVELSFQYHISPKLKKDDRAFYLGYARPSGIKRTRKRLSRRAALMDHTGYEWSQWWPKSKKDKR